jgi:elongation factor G
MKLIEGCAEESEDLLEKFMDNPDALTEDDMIAAIRKATVEMRITPVLCGSAFKNKGVQLTSRCSCQILPSPIDVDSVTGINPKTENEEIAEMRCQ